MTKAIIALLALSSLAIHEVPRPGDCLSKALPNHVHVANCT